MSTFSSVTAPNGRVTTSVYDADSRLITRIENDVATPAGPAEDVTTAYFYDAAGRLAAVQAPTTDGSTVAVTRSAYDAAGRLVRQIANCVDTDDPANCGGADGQTPGTRTFEQNVVTDYAYDDAGNLAKVDAPDPSAASGSTGSVTTRYAYDTANRLCRVLEASTISDAVWTTAGCAGAVSGTTSTNLSTRYAYDAAGNLATATDAGGGATTYGYDAAGRMTSLTDPLGASRVWTYDALGQRTAQRNRTDPVLTNSVAWTYDGAGRILTRTADGATTTSTYDANGNRLTASAGSQTITATYDRLGRVLTVDDNASGSADTSYTYSLTNPQWTDPTGTYLVTLDAFDRPTALDEPVSTTASFTWSYRTDGQVASRGEPNGNTTTFGYDALSRPATKETKTGSTSRAAYAWTRNQAGSVLAEASTITSDPTNNTRLFGYDPAGRLTAFTDGASTTAYGWAETLNRTSVTVGAGSPVTTTYDDANRPLDQAGVANAFTSDADGRLTARPDATGATSQRFEWDHLGRLTKVKGPTGNSAIATYTYDPLNRLRMVDYGANNRIRFRYGGLTTSAVQTIDDQSGAVIRNIGTGWTGELLEAWTGTSSNWRIFGTNGHHDLTWTAGSSGTVTGTVRYDPWGTATSITGSAPEFWFQSSWADDTTKLSWVITRWYAPDQGRFISEDSLTGEPRDPDSRHLYAYGGGEPIARWDPDGQFAIAIGFVVVAVAVVALLAVNAAVQTGIYLRRHPISLSLPAIEWGRSFEQREVDRLKAKFPGGWIQPNVYFWTPSGVRYLDACRYSSILHWAVAPNRNAIECYEMKSTIAAKNTYFNNGDNKLQYAKDKYISGKWKLPIILIYAGCWWSNGYLYCYRSPYS